MKNLTAVVKVNGSYKNMKEEMATKKEFKEELKANGFQVVAILTDKEITEIKAISYHEVNEIQEYVQQVL